MANETTLTITGFLTADPELRFTPSGVAVANFTVASNPRVFNKPTGQWRDGDPIFIRCAVWRNAAENVVNSVSKGERVIVHGRLIQKSYDTREGEKRITLELLVDEIGPSLKWATAKITRTACTGAGEPATADDEPPF